MDLLVFVVFFFFVPSCAPCFGSLRHPELNKTLRANCISCNGCSWRLWSVYSQTLRFDEAAPSATIAGAQATPLQECLEDGSLGHGDRLAFLNQISLVVAGVFEAALR